MPYAMLGVFTGGGNSATIEDRIQGVGIFTLHAALDCLVLLAIVIHQAFMGNGCRPSVQ
jgi:hypothetical protein